MINTICCSKPAALHALAAATMLIVGGAVTADDNRENTGDEEPAEPWLEFVEVDDPASILTADRRYHPIGQPVEVTIDDRVQAHGEVIEIVVMDADGIMVLPPAVTAPGTVDLSEEVGDLESLEHPAFVQVLVDQQAIGAPLIIQPLVDPPEPIIEEQVMTDGSVHLRVVGWSDETPDEEDETAENDAHDADADSNADADGRAENEEEGEDVPRLTAEVDEDPSPVVSGYRVEPHVDLKLHTSSGGIRIALRPDVAPNTCRHVRDLADGGFYDGLTFHRIVPMRRDGELFIIQAGDPTGTGAGGPGRRLALERSRLEHDFGVVSMARGPEPHSAGSQFFICLSREGTAHLDGQYCAFAEVVAGADAIDAIADAELADVAVGRPADPPVIERAELIPAPPIIPGEGRPDRRIERDDTEPEPEPDRIPR